MGVSETCAATTLASAGAGSKLAKARDLGVAVLDEDGWLALVGG